jgi:hypothetical protein
MLRNSSDVAKLVNGLFSLTDHSCDILPSELVFIARVRDYEFFWLVMNFRHVERDGEWVEVIVVLHQLFSGRLTNLVRRVTWEGRQSTEILITIRKVTVAGGAVIQNTSTAGTTVIAAPPHPQEGDLDMDCTFVTGDLVALKDGVIAHSNMYGDKVPLPGMIYTVREVLITPDHPANPFPNQPALLFMEIVNPPRAYVDGFSESYCAASAFRKIPRPNIEVFREILNKTPVLEDA